MSFDELFARPGPHADEQPEVHVSPPWWGPAADELAVCVPQNTLLARSPRAYVGITHAFAYSSGVELQFVAYGRRLEQSEVHNLFHGMHGFGGADAPDTFLRIGLELADGNRTSNLGPRHRSYDEQPDGPVLMQLGGGGGSSNGRAFTTRPGYWLWPLPPPGPLTVWCEWPALEIALTSTQLDAGALVAAAERSTAIWPD